MRRCTGALLCGGRSSRMGRDKAFIKVNGEALWRLQLAKLQGLCDEVIVCGNSTQAQTLESTGVRFESDADAALGPLSGIACAMQAATSAHVLVLAVDMPRMSERYLANLLELSTQESGVVPQNGGIFEGLCAVYPVSMHSLVLRLLNGAERSIQHLVEPGLEERLLRSKPVEFSERALFENWNLPSDVVLV